MKNFFAISFALFFAVTECFTQPPAVGFSTSVTIGCFPFIVTFYDTSANNPTSWLWDFGDDSASTSVSPMHIYSDTGFYTITLEITDTNTCTDVASIQIEGIMPPTANFTLDAFLAQCPPLLVHFTDFSTNITDSIVFMVLEFRRQWLRNRC